MKKTYTRPVYTLHIAKVKTKKLKNLPLKIFLSPSSISSSLFRFVLPAWTVLLKKGKEKLGKFSATFLVHNYSVKNLVSKLFIFWENLAENLKTLASESLK